MAIKPFVPYRPFAGGPKRDRDVPVAAASSVPEGAEPFRFFWRGPFSNWYMRDFVVDGVVYDCNEQYMMAEKGRLFGDGAAVRRIMAARTPKEQKALGRDVAGFVESVWIDNRLDIVAKGAFHKFDQHEDLAEAILATEGFRLVEASPYDRIWGIGLAESDPRATDRRTWCGLNLLGDVLTDRVRPAVAQKRAASPRP